MTSTLPRRLGALAVALVLGVAIAPASAALADDMTAPFVNASLASLTITIGTNESTAGKTSAVELTGCCKGQLPDRVTVQLDVSGAAGVLVVAVFGAPCTASGPVTTCEVDPGGSYDPQGAGFRPDGAIQVNLKVANGAKVGDKASLKLTASGAGLRSITTNDPVEVVASGPDLVSRGLRTDLAKPGDLRQYTPEVHNSGDATAKFVRLDVNADIYVRVGQQYSNCRYDPLKDGETAPEHGYCEFEVDLAPGETVQFGPPMSVRVQPDVPNHFVALPGYQVRVVDGPLQPLPGPAPSGPVLQPVKVAARPIPGGAVEESSFGFGDVAVPVGDNPADLSAIGAEATGAAGSRLGITLGLKNGGPADAVGLVGDGGSIFSGRELPLDSPDRPAATVTFPAGTTVLSVPNGIGLDGMQGQGNVFCFPVVDGKPDLTKQGLVHGLVYWCTASSILDLDETEPIRFTVSISGTAVLTGTIVVSGGGNDPNTANNTASIRLIPPGATDVPSTGGGQGGGGTSTVSLPVTGRPTGIIAVGGLLLLLLGLGLVLLTRRGRARPDA